MTDVFTAEKRSEVMARIRSTGTKPEAALYEAVAEILGESWSIDRNVKALPGSPDIVIEALRVAIFVDGCFFHLCPKHGRIPDTNREYWEPKLLANKRRDQAQRARLRRMGYSVWRFWGHDFKNKAAWARARGRLDRLLTDKAAHAKPKAFPT